MTKNMKMGFFFKTKIAIIAIGILLIALILFGIYTKVKDVQSIQYMESQAQANKQLTSVMMDISTTLKSINKNLDDIDVSMCLIRAGDDQAKIDNCYK